VIARAVPLREALDGLQLGGKAVQLGAALRAGLPVPDGVVLPPGLVKAAVAGDTGAREALERLATTFDGPVAVRSSGIGEDGTTASFAGQHGTRLNVPAGGLVAAVVEVWRSGHSDGALAYRRAMGLDGTVAVAVVVQRLIAADRAGVMFTRHPIDGRHELVIEAAWGLGEAVVGGQVIPDRYHLAPTGEVIERVAGEKQVAVLRGPSGGTFLHPLPAEQMHRLCLSEQDLDALGRLAGACEVAMGPARDVEWAFDARGLHLLQCRPMTTVATLAAL